MTEHQHVIITGNPVAGLRFFGPFEDLLEAIEWAEINCPADWWMADLELGEY